MKACKSAVLLEMLLHSVSSAVLRISECLVIVLLSSGLQQRLKQLSFKACVKAWHVPDFTVVVKD